MMVPVPSNALGYITVKGFKSIASIEKLALRPINVLIGANGSGKSNFVEVFGFLRAIHEGRLKDYVTAAGGAEKVLHFGSKRTKELSVELSFSNAGSSYPYALNLSVTSDDGLFLSREWWGSQNYLIQKCPNWIKEYLERCRYND